MKGTPALLPNCNEGLQTLLDDPAQKQWAEEFLIAFDSLHNMKGNNNHLLARIRTWKGEWDDNLFLGLLDQHVQRRLVSELDGSHFRLLIVLWAKVILPALEKCPEPKKTKVKMLFHHLSEVSFIVQNHTLV